MKSTTSFSRSGTSDWLAQRVSAVILAAYCVVIVGWLLLAGEVAYDAWHDFMTGTTMRIFSVLALLSLAAHSWVGLWTITTDYMTTRQMGASANFLRIITQIVMAIAIFVYVVWGVMILWGN